MPPMTQGVAGLGLDPPPPAHLLRHLGAVPLLG